MHLLWLQQCCMYFDKLVYYWLIDQEKNDVYSFSRILSNILLWDTHSRGCAWYGYFPASIMRFVYLQVDTAIIFLQFIYRYKTTQIYLSFFTMTLYTYIYSCLITFCSIKQMTIYNMHYTWYNRNCIYYIQINYCWNDFTEDTCYVFFNNYI